MNKNITGAMAMQLEDDDEPMVMKAGEHLAMLGIKHVPGEKDAKPDDEHGIQPKIKRGKGPTPKGHARNIYEEFGKPLAFFGDSFWAFDNKDGWINVTRPIIRKAIDCQNKDASRTIMPVLTSILAVPGYGENDTQTLYWERQGGFDGTWKPVHIEQHEVVFADGILDCITGDFTERGGRVIFGPQLSQCYLTEMDEDPICPEFEAMIRRMFPDKDIRRHFQEMAGLVLTPHHIMRGQVILIGAPKSGKTTLATAIGCAPCGPKGMAVTQEYALAKDKWARTDLLGKFINVSDDSARVADWPNFVKQYTSGKFKIEFKYQTPINVLGTAKLWSTCNEMQDTADASGAMFDRVNPFKVEGRIDFDTERTEYMTTGFWNTAERRAGIVTWMLEGLKRYWMRGGKPLVPQAWLDQKIEAVGQGDPLEGWLRDNLTTGEGELDKRALEEKMPADMVPPAKSNRLDVYIKRLFLIDSSRVVRDGSRLRIYSGLAWKQ